ENGTRVPIQLIDGPWYDGRFGEFADTLRLVTTQRFCERVARGGELVERLLIERVDVRVERRHLRMRDLQHVIFVRLEESVVHQVDAVRARHDRAADDRRAGDAELVRADRGALARNDLAVNHAEEGARRQRRIEARHDG